MNKPVVNDLIDETLTEKPTDAATVILIRQNDSANNGDIQTLLLCRGNSRTVMNSAWVFPGGKLDTTDFKQTTSIQNQLPEDARELLNEPELDSNTATALFTAACRETFEETGVQLSPSQLQTWSRWITPNEPSMMKKRFDARFFIAALPDGQTAIHDGIEATDSQWATARQALQDYVDNKIVLAPPQIMSLISISNFNTVQECLEHAKQTQAYKIQPQVIKATDTRTLTYPGDSAHTEAEQRMPGPTRLEWHKTHFEPPGGFGQYLPPYKTH